MNHHISRHESYDSFSSFHEDVNSPLTCYNSGLKNNENNSVSSGNFPMSSIQLSKVLKIGYITHDNGNLQTESHEAPAKYNSSVATKPKSTSTKLNVIGEYDSVDSNGISKENLIQLEKLPHSYLENCVDFDLPSLVLKANIGMKKGVKPVLADGAMGGTYFLRDENQKFAVICKPGDEEPNSPHNPHQTKPGEAVWRGWYRGRIVPGFGMYREVAAFLLDAGFAGVPPTQLARVRDYLLRLEAEPLVQSNNISVTVSENQSKDPLPSSSASVYKICSVQSYARHECSAEDMGSSKFHTDDVHRIAALDIRLCNLDRHEGNILVCKSNPYIRNIGDNCGDNDYSGADRPDIDVVRGSKYHLVPIDHGYVLPHVLCMNDPSLSWMNWSQSREPLSPALLDYIASLDYTRDAELLRRVVGAALAETSLLTLQVCTSFLKKGSAAGLTLYEMGSAMCPPDYNQDQPNSIPSTKNSSSNNYHRTSSHHSTASTSSHTNHNPNQPISLLQKVAHIAVHNVLLMQTSLSSSFSKTDFDMTQSSTTGTTTTTTLEAIVVTPDSVAAALNTSADDDDDKPKTHTHNNSNRNHTHNITTSLTPAIPTTTEDWCNNNDNKTHQDVDNDDNDGDKAATAVTVNVGSNIHGNCDISAGSSSSNSGSSSSIMSVSPVSVTQLMEFEEKEMEKEMQCKRANNDTHTTVLSSISIAEVTITESETVVASLSQSNLEKHTNNTNATNSLHTAVQYKSTLSQTSEKTPYAHHYNHNQNSSNNHHHNSPAPSLASTSSKSDRSNANHHFLTRSLTLSYAAAVVCGGGLHHSKNSRSSSVDETIATNVTESTVRVTEEMLYRALYIDKAYQNQQHQQIQYQQQQAHNHHHSNKLSEFSSSSSSSEEPAVTALIHSVLEYEMDLALDRLVAELLFARVINDDDDVRMTSPSIEPVATVSSMNAAAAVASLSLSDTAATDSDEEDGMMENADVGVD